MSQTAAFPVHRTLAAGKLAQTEEALAAKGCFFFLCLFTVAIYLRPEDIFPAVGHFHLTLALGVCAAAAYLGASLSGDAPLLNSRELRLMLWLTVWFMVGIPFSYWRGGSVQVLAGTWLKTLLVFFLLTQTLISLKRIRVILWTIILSELVVAAYSTLDPSQSNWVGDRLAGVSQGILGWNFLGIAAALTIPYIAVLFITHPSFIRSSLLTAATAAMMWMLILTASRGGMMTVAFSILLTSLLILRRNLRGRLIGLGLIIALVATIAAAPGVFWDRIQTIWSDSSPGNKVSASADASTEERQAILKASIQYTIEHPIVGLGLGNFSVARGTETGLSTGWNGTHNTFTELSSEAGVPALLIFLALLGSSIAAMWRVTRAPKATAEGAELDAFSRATLASLLAFLFGAFFAHIAYEYFLYYPIAVGVAIAYLSRDSQTAVETPDRRKSLAARKLFGAQSA
jgi:O-antigen ligase